MTNNDQHNILYNNNSIIMNKNNDSGLSFDD